MRKSQSVLSGPVPEANNAKYGHISRVSQLSKDDFLCSPDCVAERGGFEPSIQVLASNTNLANASFCMPSTVVAAVALFAYRDQICFASFAVLSLTAANRR